MLSTLKLSSKTYLGKQQLKKVKTILQSLLDSNESFDFRTPVDWKGLGLLDYCFLIKNPMDLGTVNQKLKDDRYETVEDVFDDIQLIWDNCKTYNPPNSWIHTIAEKLERSFKKMAKNYLPSIAIIVPGRNSVGGIREDKKVSHAIIFEQDQNEGITYHQKMKFYQKMRHLGSQQIGQIVSQLQTRCPSALKQNGEDNIQIIVDNMDTRTFRELTSMMQNILIGIQQKIVNKIKSTQ